MTIKHNETKAYKRSKRVRSKIHGTAERPRLTVFRSNKNISLQVINDDSGLTLAQASDMGKNNKIKGTKTEKAKQVAEALLPLLDKAKVKKLVFDRGSYRYHGRVKIVAETLREGGVQL